MTHPAKLLLACASSAFVLGCAQTAVQAPPAAAAPAAEVERWAWQPIARDEQTYMYGALDLVGDEFVGCNGLDRAQMLRHRHFVLRIARKANENLPVDLTVYTGR